MDDFLTVVSAGSALSERGNISAMCCCTVYCTYRTLSYSMTVRNIGILFQCKHDTLYCMQLFFVCVVGRKDFVRT